MSKEQTNEKTTTLTQQEYLLAEVVMKVAALERLLVKANIITPEILNNEMKAVSDDVMAFVAKQIENTPKDTETNKDNN